VFEDLVDHGIGADLARELLELSLFLLDPLFLAFTDLDGLGCVLLAADADPGRAFGETDEWRPGWMAFGSSGSSGRS
jgi:hypothetical protein